jgi:hypothetical protein
VGARNSPEMLDFIEPAAAAGKCEQASGAFFCPIRGIKCKNFVRRYVPIHRDELDFMYVNSRLCADIRALS